jgi:PAS domain S-box-containing protein
MTASTGAPFDNAVFGTAEAAVDFIGNLLEASTEYSIIGKDLDGLILLWNEGARRLYGYEAVEVVGQLNSNVLHTAEDLAARKPAEAMVTALADGKWEGTTTRVRKDGTQFPARVVITPRRDATGTAVGFLLISKDISDEVRLTLELQATERYTRSLIESNIDALMTTDPVGVITDVNQEMTALTGHSREELIGSPFKQYFTEPALAEEGIRQALRDGKVTNYELTARSKSGTETTVSYNATSFYDSEQRLQGVFAAARDITEHKNLEWQLRNSEAYNRGLIEASVDGLITVDPQGMISDVNEQMCRLSGYPREELIGTAFAGYFADTERATAGVTTTLEQGVVTDYVLALARREGAPLQVSFNASVFANPSGAVGGIFASARDITEQAALQDQLNEERLYNRGLIEASLEGLVTVDPMMVITDVNEQICRMAGYEREALIGSSFDQHFTDPAAAAAGVRLTLDRGMVTGYELTLKAAGGSAILVSFNAAVFTDAAGQVRGIFASARDVTEQAALQRQLDEERTYNRGLIEASVDGLVTVDESMIITDVNETFCRMSARQRQKLIGSAFVDHFTEGDRAAQGVSLTFDAGLVTNYVLTMTTGDGREIPVSFNAATFCGADGDVRGILASARDISDQVRLERQFRDSEAYTRSLIESNIDALMTTDPLGIISDVNQQMEHLTGCSRDELVGSPFKQYFTDPDRAEDGVRLTLREGRVTNYELTARTKDGVETTVSYNASTFYDRDEKLQGVFAAARVISEQKDLEDQLREQQTYLRGLIESSVDGLVTVDPEGFITDVNEQMCEMAGYGRAELIGTPFADYFTDRTAALEGVQQTFRDEVVTEYGLTLMSRSRRPLQVSFNASVFRDGKNQVKGIFASARDITDRVRLEDQLREQQTYLRGLIESSVDGLVTVDPEGFITDVNEQLCRMSGYGREQLVGSVFKEYFTEPALADEGVLRTLAQGVVTNYELVLKASTGRKATVSFNASVFRDAEGSIQGIFASARDISEQAHLQHQLAEHQAYNRSLIEASADALFAIAPDGTITDVNEEATRLTGYSRNHLVNSSFSTYFTDANRAQAGVEKTFAERRVIGYELVLVSRHARRIQVSFNAGVFNDASETPLGILASARDITAQKELEVRLRDSQLYTRTLIESNIDALMTTDQLGIISDVNQQMEKLTGHGRSELIGTPFKEYFTEPARAEDGVRQVLQDGKVEDYELTVLAKDGAETVVSYNASTFTDQEGRLQGVFAAARDVTDRRRFEYTLQEKNLELESANLAKDSFLANMSHELRTPLNAIIGFTGTMLMELPGPLNDEQREQLNTVQGAGEHLLTIINDLLDLAKIESGEIELTFQPVDCEEVSRQVAASLVTVAEGKSLVLEVLIDPGVDAIVRTDRRAVQQILLNLVNNGLKFTDDGAVTVTLLRADDGGRLAIQVTDTGCGIGETDRAKLFVPFEQLVSTNMTPREGTGLGLYISKRLATAVDGTLELESVPGQGSTFTLSLPAA